MNKDDEIQETVAQKKDNNKSLDRLKSCVDLYEKRKTLSFITVRRVANLRNCCFTICGGIKPTHKLKIHYRSFSSVYHWNFNDTPIPLLRRKIRMD